MNKSDSDENDMILQLEAGMKHKELAVYHTPTGFLKTRYTLEKKIRMNKSDSDGLKRR
ncbi:MULTISPECIES: hypothetical protein [Vibrio]|uniref:hypothetical protein n=1 Tax=Vibrio TaxID=662 RepID=UPI00078BDEDB|nr:MULTISPECIES: hypothetical protein [Vibrio]BAU70968.1 hypothetical protein [Vibrio sp. 04Ya108]BBM67774.1 hypothetical protein VA249_44200 [Vibrio alfacsensis]BCN26945.1 hypothetical protein VYA_41370 [Vibrio alfacsensis]